MRKCFYRRANFTQLNNAAGQDLFFLHQSENVAGFHLKIFFWRSIKKHFVERYLKKTFLYIVNHCVEIDLKITPFKRIPQKKLFLL